MHETAHPLKDYAFVLASKSPRRKDLLSLLNVPTTVRHKTIDESYPADLIPEQIPVYLAEKKAKAFENETFADNEILITADTIVICEGKAIGKPKDREQAIETLQQLSDKRHKVITGCCISHKNKRQSFNVSTDVYFKVLTTEEIHFYVDHYQPFDKAGAYGVQEWIGCIGVERIEGSFYNVVGLPLQRLYTEICKLVCEQIR